MGTNALDDEGFAYYTDELRRGSTDPYVAYRICERFWKVARKDRALVRQAMIRLIESDPWFMATVLPYSLDALETEDLERLTPFVGAGPAQKAAAMLRATLWYNGRKGPYRADKVGRAQLRRALTFLRDVRPKQRHLAWHEMLVGCYRVLSYDKYKHAFGTLLKKTEPEERAWSLNGFLNAVAAKKDWKAYDRYRREWDKLPPSHSSCECYVNGVHTNDGLRAIVRRDWAAAADALTRARAVRGCPHLNTGGLRLDLVRVLIAKRKHLDAARAYLDCAEAFDARNEELSKLSRQLAAATI